MVSLGGFGCCRGRPLRVRLLVAEWTPNQRLDGFEENGLQMMVVGHHVRGERAVNAEKESRDYGGAQVGRRSGEKRLLDEAGAEQVYVVEAAEI